MHESAAISIYLGPNKPLLLIAYSSAMSTTQWQIHRIGGITFLSKKIVILPYILKKKEKKKSALCFLILYFFSDFFQWYRCKKSHFSSHKASFIFGEKNESCNSAIERQGFPCNPTNTILCISKDISIWPKLILRMVLGLDN